MQFKLKGFLKSLRYIFGRKDEDDDEEEEEIRIGGPTDVKHVAHIGWDGPAATPPAWMDEFHGDESGNLEAGKPGGGGTEDQSSTSQQQVSSKGNKQGKRRKVDNTTKKQRSNNNNNNNNNNEGEVQLQGSKPKKGAGRKKKPKEDQGPDPLTDKRNTSSFED